MAGETRRFKRVLHIREVERQITQGELAERMREESKLMQRLDVVQKERDRALDDFCSGRDEIISPQQMWFERQSIDVIERTLDSGRQELASCRQEIEATKVVLVEKHRNVQLMARHVEKWVDRDNKETLALEQKNLDDITSMRFLRGRREGQPA